MNVHTIAKNRRKCTVPSTGIEPISQVPETCVLSIELRRQLIVSFCPTYQAQAF